MKKRILSAIVATSMVLTLVISSVISVGAEGIDKTSKSVTIGKSYTLNLKVAFQTYDYKIVVPKDGTLTLSFETWAEHLNFIMFDDLGNEVKATKTNPTTGAFSYGGYICSWDLYNAIDRKDTNRLYWNTTKEEAKGTASFKCAKGTYYVRMARCDTGLATVKFGISLKDLDGKTLNQDGTLKDSSKTETTTPIFTITVKKGEKLQLGLDTTSKSTITYKSSDKTIATVSSKGTVTGVEKGTVTITATIDKVAVKVKIKVTE